MCIIAIKGYGVEYPSTDRVRTMCINNPDGFALAYYVKGADGFDVFRTMNRDEFIAEYEAIKERHNKDDIGLFIHARISTHGSNKLENCHGWVDKDCGLGFAHNGILSIQNRDDMTDSETFFRDLFIPAFSIGGWTAGDRAVNAVIGTSKFVFINASGSIRYYGDYIRDEDGCLYSNYTYRNFGYHRLGCNSYGGWGGSSKKGKESEKTEENDQYSWWNDYDYDYDGWYDREYYGH